MLYPLKFYVSLLPSAYGIIFTKGFRVNYLTYVQMHAYICFIHAGCIFNQVFFSSNTCLICWHYEYVLDIET